MVMHILHSSVFHDSFDENIFHKSGGRQKPKDLKSHGAATKLAHLQN